MDNDLTSILSTISQQQQEILAAIRSMAPGEAPGAVILQADAAADAARLTKSQEELKKNYLTSPSLSPPSRLELVAWKRGSAAAPGQRFYRATGA